MALGKPVLPALVADVSPNLLPPSIAALQLVDHRALNRESALQLGRALHGLPAAPVLPSPLPAAPSAPLSYLGTLSERVDSDEPLDLQAQSSLLIDIKRALRDPEYAADGLAVLQRFRRRRDLLAVMADELDELLRSAPHDLPPAQAPLAEAAPASSLPRDPWRRRTAALSGLLLGSAIGIPAALSSGQPETWFAGLILGAASAIAGAITGVRRRHIVPAVLAGLGTGLVGFVLANESGSHKPAFAIAACIGAPGGVILGAALSTLLRRRSPPEGIQRLPG
jgi:uncharacterized membrane protein (UPF0136 family)